MADGSQVARGRQDLVARNETLDKPMQRTEASPLGEIPEQRRADGMRARLRGIDQAPCHKHPSRVQVLPAARNLTAIGHSSGWDMLTGFVIGVAGTAALPERTT